MFLVLFFHISIIISCYQAARGSVATNRKVAVSIPEEVIIFKFT
jgi:hypothetical protein